MYGIVQNTLERLYQKFRGLDTRVTALEDSGGGPPPGGTVTLTGDVIGSSNSNTITSIQGQKIQEPLSTQGSLWTFDPNSGEIVAISGPTESNLVLYSDLAEDSGIKFKPQNIVPNCIFEATLADNYVLSPGVQFFQLNFDSLAGDITLKFPKMDGTELPFFFDIYKLPGFIIGLL